MGKLLQLLYPFLKVLQFFIVYINDFCFWIYNTYFQERQIVSKPENEVLLIPAVDLAAMIRENKLKCVTLVQAYIDRIKVVNPILNAVIEDNFEGALAEAKRVDAYLDEIDRSSDEFKNLAETKPFLGVPFTIKDTFNVNGFHVSCGMHAYKDQIAQENAVLVQQMLDAGAIFLCRTNVPEGGLWGETANNLYGRSKNPYDSRRSCGGSSGAEGALVGAAASILSVGSDIGGSVRIPASHNGIFALKPSVDVVPKKGQFPDFDTGYRSKMLTAGPICRYSKDLAPMLRVFVGNEIAEKQLQLSKPVDLSQLKFYSFEDFNTPFVIPLDQTMRNAVRKTVKYFENKFGKSIFKVDFTKIHHALTYYYVSLADPTAAPYSKILTNHKHEINLYTEIWKKLRGQSIYTIPAFIMLTIEEWAKYFGISVASSKYYESQRDKLREEVLALLKDDGILICSAWPTVAQFHNSQLCLPFNFPVYTGIFNVLRLPAVVVPLGLDSNGIPISVQLIAGPNNDRLLIAAAQELEAAFGGWRIPGSQRGEM